MNIFIDTIKGKLSENYNTPPIWLMRQAGRYLPEYRKVREEAGSFLNLCYNPDLASKVTLQPITRFDFDAAIIFADILVIPHMLGLDLEFVEGEGPKVEKIKTTNDLNKLNIQEPENCWQMQKIFEGLSLVRESLPNNKSLIGFAGSPWTVATYLISDKKNDFDYCRNFCYQNESLIDNLIEIITQQTIIYLKGKIKNGADVIQLFDSWSGLLTPDLFQRYVINPTAQIVKSLKEEFPEIPIIGFPKGAGLMLKSYLEQIKIDVLGLDYYIPLDYAKQLKEISVIQGNLDPLILLNTKSMLEHKLENIMNKLSGNNFIFNLGHGILPSTPIENVEFLVNYVRKFKK